jgi:hypothetical protein
VSEPKWLLALVLVARALRRWVKTKLCDRLGLLDREAPVQRECGLGRITRKLPSLREISDSKQNEHGDPRNKGVGPTATKRRANLTKPHANPD